MKRILRPLSSFAYSRLTAIQAAGKLLTEREKKPAHFGRDDRKEEARRELARISLVACVAIEILRLSSSDSLRMTRRRRWLRATKKRLSLRRRVMDTRRRGGRLWSARRPCLRVRPR